MSDEGFEFPAALDNSLNPVQNDFNNSKFWVRFNGSYLKTDETIF